MATEVIVSPYVVSDTKNELTSYEIYVALVVVLVLICLVYCYMMLTKEKPEVSLRYVKGDRKIDGYYVMSTLN